jgi:hypothetical protein
MKAHLCTSTVTGSLLGIPGHGRRVSFRILHIWDFDDGKISRENVWLDSAAVVAQLTALAAGDGTLPRLRLPELTPPGIGGGVRA